MDVNTCTFSGHLTNDPNVKNVGDKVVVEFGLANNRGFGDKKRAMFFTVSWWGQTAAKMAQNLSKGKPVAVTGELREDRWDDNGTQKSKLKINASEEGVVFLSSPQSARDQAPQYQQPQVPQQPYVPPQQPAYAPPRQFQAPQQPAYVPPRQPAYAPPAPNKYPVDVSGQPLFDENGYPVNPQQPPQRPAYQQPPSRDPQF